MEKKPYDPNAMWDRHQYGIWISASKWEGILIGRLKSWYSDLTIRTDLFEDGVQRTIRDAEFLDHQIKNKAREIEVVCLITESDEMPTEINISSFQSMAFTQKTGTLKTSRSMSHFKSLFGPVLLK